MSTSITWRHIGVWIAAAVCLIPTANSNIRPAWESGAWGVVLNQSVFVVIMASLPLVASLVRAVPLKMCLYLLAAGLFVYSLYNAVHMGHRAQEASTGPAHALLSKADAYRKQIGALEAKKKAIVSKPGYETVSEERVRLAKSSVDTAAGRRESAKAKEAMDKIAAARDTTKSVEVIDAEIKDWNQKLIDLGPIPTSVDFAAAAVGGAAHEGLVSTIILFLYAFITEGPAFVGPIAVISASGLYRREEIARAEPPTIQPSTKVETEIPARPAKRTPRKKEVDKGDCVKRWIKERTAKSAGDLLQCGEAHADYERWCRLPGNSGHPLKLASFGKIMKEIGVQKKRQSGYLYYIGIALQRQPALHVVNG